MIYLVAQSPTLKIMPNRESPFSSFTHIGCNVTITLSRPKSNLTWSNLVPCKLQNSNIAPKLYYCILMCTSRSKIACKRSCVPMGRCKECFIAADRLFQQGSFYLINHTRKQTQSIPTLYHVNSKNLYTHIMYLWQKIDNQCQHFCFKCSSCCVYKKAW